MVSGAHLPLLA